MDIKLYNDESKNLKLRPIVERTDIFVPGVEPYLVRRNGSVTAVCGGPGSGKSSLILSLFNDKNGYKNRFKTIFFFCPAESYNSVKNHPFEKMKNVEFIHDFNDDTLDRVYQELVQAKEKAFEKPEEEDEKKNSWYFKDIKKEEEEPEEEEEEKKRKNYTAVLLLMILEIFYEIILKS